MFQSGPSLKTIKIHKELLLAEAEVLRAQMGQDFGVIRRGFAAWGTHAKSVASHAAVAAAIFALVSKFRQAGKAEVNRKPSLLSRLLAGARTAFGVWMALRSRQR